jgi:exodeoxyribonuclease V gamma subunit
VSAPRRGDRDTRSEDRYVFLEALMAARAHLHVSYLGEGVNDGKPRNPSSALAELLQFLDRQLRTDAVAPARPWWVRHPLQPYDPRYFRAATTPAEDPRLFSFDAAFADFPRTSLPAPPFVDAMAVPDASQGERDGRIALMSLRRFWRDPARTFLREELGLSREALADDAWPDTEALEARTDRRERVGRRLLLDALTRGIDVLPANAPLWLTGSGLLAAGAAGERAYAELRETTQEMLVQARAVLPAKPSWATQRIDLDLGDGLRIAGGVTLLRGAPGEAWLFEGKPQASAGFRELLTFYMDWAALRLSGATEALPLFLEYSAPDGVRMPPLFRTFVHQDPAQLRAGLRRLAGVANGIRGEPVYFFPRSAWDWLHAGEAERKAAARRGWRGDYENRGERAYAPGYAELLTRGGDPIDSSEGYARFVAAATLVADVLDPERSVLRMPAERPA